MVWDGAVNRKVIFVRQSLAAIVTVGVSMLLFSKDTVELTSSSGTKQLISGDLVGFIVLVAGFIFVLIRCIYLYKIAYAITNKRIIIRSGIIGADLNSITFQQIKSSNVNVGLIGKIFSTGTINIDTGKVETVTHGTGTNKTSETRTAYDRLLDIDTPYEVYKNIQSVSASRQESLYSGRADMENNTDAYRNANEVVTQPTTPPTTI